MVNRSRLAALVALLLAGILTGCTSGQYAYGLQESDVVGAWSTVNGPEIELVLDSDGTLLARQWPAALACSNGDVQSIDDLELQPTATVTGEWSVFPGEQPGGLPTVSLSITGAACSEPLIVAYLWRDQEDLISACIPLDPVLDADNFVPSRTLMFTRQNEDAASDNACFG